MTTGRILLSIGMMAGITYLVRMLPLAAFRKPITSRFLRAFLEYVPYAVLAAMTFPAVFSSTSGLISALAGTLTALVLAYFGRGLLTVALSGAAAVFLTELALRIG